LARREEIFLPSAVAVDPVVGWSVGDGLLALSSTPIAGWAIAGSAAAGCAPDAEAALMMGF
jgi:hypothetical protein